MEKEDKRIKRERKCNEIDKKSFRSRVYEKHKVGNSTPLSLRFASFGEEKKKLRSVSYQ